MPSIFTKIINREIPAYIVYEDDKVIAFLDISPIELGHTLLVSKNEVDNWLDVLPEDYLAVQNLAQKLGKAISKSVSKSVSNNSGFERIGQLVDGRQMPHFHLHLIPIMEDKEITHNMSKRLTFSPEQMQEIQTQIIKNLE
jgi:histidine triad (HIT) family protein